MIVVNNKLIFDNEYEECSYNSTYFNIYYNKSKWYESVVKKLIQEVGSKYEKELRSIVTNTARALKSNSTCFTIPRDRNLYTNNPQKISYNKMMKIVDKLIELDYVYVLLGGPIEWDGRGNPTKLLPSLTVFTEKYVGLWEKVNLSCVSVFDKTMPSVSIRKRGTKDELSTRGVVGVKDIKTKVDRYNKSLVNCTIRIADKETSKVMYRRIFNDDLNHGGRWYEVTNNLQNQKADLRNEIIINDEKTIELDYSSLHASIAYEKLGIQMENGFKPYDIPEKAAIRLDQAKVDAVQKSLDENFIQKKYDPIRNLCKLALLCAFNCDSLFQAQGAVVQDVLNERKLVQKGKKPLYQCKYYGVEDFISKDFCAGILHHNYKIEEFIFADKGILFQNIDSMMTDYIIERFLWEDEIVLPWHDSYLCREGLESFLHKTMEDAYESVLGSKLNCKIEKKF